MLYALIGIPGTCLNRKSIGHKITELFTKLITNRLLSEKRFEKITSDSKSGAKSCVDNDCGNCGLSITIKKWSYIKCFQFTFTALRTIGFGDYLPQFKNNADYSFVLLAFA